MLAAQRDDARRSASGSRSRSSVVLPRVPNPKGRSRCGRMRRAYNGLSVGGSGGRGDGARLLGGREASRLSVISRIFEGWPHPPLGSIVSFAAMQRRRASSPQPRDGQSLDCSIQAWLRMPQEPDAALPAPCRSDGAYEREHVGQQGTIQVEVHSADAAIVSLRGEHDLESQARVTAALTAGGVYRPCSPISRLHVRRLVGDRGAAARGARVARAWRRRSSWSSRPRRARSAGRSR